MLGELLLCGLPATGTDFMTIVSDGMGEFVDGTFLMLKMLYVWMHWMPETSGRWG